MTVGALLLSLSISIVEETDKYRHAMGRNVVTMESYTTMRQIYNLWISGSTTDGSNAGRLIFLEELFLRDGYGRAPYLNSI